MRNWIVGVFGAFALLIVGPGTAWAGPYFGWACTSNCVRDGGELFSPAGFMLEINELDGIDFEQGTFWPTFLFQIDSISLSYYDEPASILTVDGNPFGGWSTIRGGGYVTDYSAYQRLLFASMNDWSTTPLFASFGDLRIWSTPTIAPDGSSYHDVWSISFGSDPTQVSTGLLTQCDVKADCLSPTHRVPEPSTVAIVAAGLAAAAIRRRRRRG